MSTPQHQQQRIGCFGVIAILIAIGWVANQVGLGGSSDDDEPDAVSEAPWRVSVARKMSFCDPSPLDAQVRFVVWIRNRDPIDREVNVLPVRDYNDGTTNDSILDLVTASIDASSRQFIDQTYSYNALKHDVIRCSVKLDAGRGLGEEIPIRVSGP